MFNINKKTSSTTTSWISMSYSESEMTAGQRRFTGDIFVGSRKFLFAVALFVLLAGVHCAADQKTVKPSPVSPLSSSSASIAATPKDEIYIDDESIEGSGGRSGLHDDLEKDPDYSGSGFGPDDEDSSTDLQQSHRGSNSQTHSGKHNTNINNNHDDNDDLITSRTHHQTNSGTIIGTNSGSNTGILSGNSGSNTGLNTIATTSTKHQTSSSTSTNQNSPDTSITSTSSATASKNHDSSLYPKNTNQVQQPHLPAAPHYPAGGNAHTDDEDFDLGEGDNVQDKKKQFGGAGDNDDGLFVGSGDGGFIDHTDDDDDHTGDVDDDDDLIQRPHQRQHELEAGSKPTSNVESSGTNSSSSTTTTTSATDRKQILSFDGDEDKDEHEEGDNDDNDDDDNDDDYDDEDSKGDDKDDDIDVDGHDDTTDEDDNTEVYIDGTEPNAKGGSNSQDNEPGNTNQGNTIHELDTNNVNSQPTDTKVYEHTTGNDVLIMDTSGDDRTASFFAQPGILAAVIGGAVVGLLCAILVVMFIVYRMRKKDEGSYALDEPKRSPAVNSYAKNANNREFFA